MLETDKHEFAKVWGAAWAMYGKAVSPQLLSIAFESLRAYTIEEVRIGLTRHIQSPDTGQFFPKPADVIKHIDGNSGSRAFVAWNKVDKAIRHVGAWTSVMFDDPIIHRVIADMGGWVALCKVDDREFPFKQKEFVTRYQAYLLRGEHGQYPRLLQGLADHQNLQKGYDMQAPVAVGDTHGATQVFQHGIADYSPVTLKRIDPEALQRLIGYDEEDANK